MDFVSASLNENYVEIVSQIDNIDKRFKNDTFDSSWHCQQIPDNVFNK